MEIFSFSDMGFADTDEFAKVATKANLGLDVLNTMVTTAVEKKTALGARPAVAFSSSLLPKDIETHGKNMQIKGKSSAEWLFRGLIPTRQELSKLKDKSKEDIARSNHKNQVAIDDPSSDVASQALSLYLPEELQALLPSDAGIDFGASYPLFFPHHEDGSTLRNDDNSIVTCFKINGVYYDSVTGEVFNPEQKGDIQLEAVEVMGYQKDGQFYPAVADVDLLCVRKKELQKRRGVFNAALRRFTSAYEEVKNRGDLRGNCRDSELSLVEELDDRVGRSLITHGPETNNPLVESFGVCSEGEGNYTFILPTDKGIEIATATDELGVLEIYNYAAKNGIKFPHNPDWGWAMNVSKNPPEYAIDPQRTSIGAITRLQSEPEYQSNPKKRELKNYLNAIRLRYMQKLPTINSEEDVKNSFIARQAEKLIKDPLLKARVVEIAKIEQENIARSREHYKQTKIRLEREEAREYVEESLKPRKNLQSPKTSEQTAVQEFATSLNHAAEDALAIKTSKKPIEVSNSVA